MPSPTILSRNKGRKKRPITLLFNFLILLYIVTNKTAEARIPNSPMKEIIEDSVTRMFSDSHTCSTEYPTDESEPNPRPQGWRKISIIPLDISSIREIFEVSLTISKIEKTLKYKISRSPGDTINTMVRIPKLYEINLVPLLLEYQNSIKE